MRTGPETAGGRREMALAALGRNRALSPSARRVGFAFLLLAGGEGQAAPGIDRLAAQLALSRRSISRALAELCRADVIRRTRRGGGAGRPALFEPNWPSLVAGAGERGGD